MPIDYFYRVNSDIWSGITPHPSSQLKPLSDASNCNKNELEGKKTN